MAMAQKSLGRSHRDVKKKKKKKRHSGGLAPDRYLTKDQLARLKGFLSTQLVRATSLFAERRAATNLMIVDLLANSGLRSADLINLQMRDLPHCHGKMVIDVREGKRLVQRSVEVSTAFALRLAGFIKKYRKSAKPNSFLFLNEENKPLGYRSLYSKIVLMGKAAGVGHVTPHKLRHTYGTLFYSRNKDLLMLMDQLGHSKPETTAIYARTANEERRRLVEDFDV